MRHMLHTVEYSRNGKKWKESQGEWTFYQGIVDRNPWAEYSKDYGIWKIYIEYIIIGIRDEVNEAKGKWRASQYEK